MEKYIDINENGLSVRCKLFYQKDFRNIPNLAICTHGFGGNKENQVQGVRGPGVRLALPWGGCPEEAGPGRIHDLPDPGGGLCP